MDKLDIYVIKYIQSFLIKCPICNHLDIFYKDQKCNICKKYYCKKCENLRKVYGFFITSYCNFCYNCYAREFIT